jgi:RHS repeat-associated protein
VAGTTTTKATNVTVNGSAANRYSDATFALGGFTIVNGNNTFTAGAQDALGRTDTNSITVNLPTTVTCTYDLNGNLTSDGTRGFDYDDENQLIRITVTNSWKTEFGYDGKMRRRVRTEYTWNGSAWLNAGVTRYVYDGNLVIQERDGNGLPGVTYTRGNDLRGMLQGTGGIGGLLARTDAGFLTVGYPMASAYYHADGNGNVTALIDTNQAIVAKYLYDPFGNILSQSGTLADANLYRFSSKEIHKNSGLIYFQYRFYDPTLNRWLNQDPITDLGARALRTRRGRPFRPFKWQAYTYVRNNPISFMDAFGLANSPVMEPPSGPNGGLGDDGGDGNLCLTLAAEALAAASAAIANPNDINLLLKADAAAAAFEAAGCGDDIAPRPRICPPPQPDPTGRPPWWQRALRDVGNGLQWLGVGALNFLEAVGGLWVSPNQIPGQPELPDGGVA